MIDQFDEHQLCLRLSAISDKHRVAFAAACCERLLPNYEAFVAMEGWGDPAVLQRALDRVWRHLEGELLSAVVVGELISACELVVPDTEDFFTVFTSAAGDAGGAIVYTLECCLDGDPTRAAVVGRLATESIDQYLAIVNDPDTRTHAVDPAFEEWLDRAPLQAAEIRKQQADIRELEAHPILDHHVLGELRRSSGCQGIQPFARGLVRRAGK